ncbi:MAG: hypothetical protein J6N52_11125 [Clostridia bacterium]|nr:hypothetical protein [Clostridia bacterium]
MKRFSLFLALCIAICNISMVPIADAEGNPSPVVVPYSEITSIKFPSGDSGIANGNYVVTSAKINGVTTLTSALFVKFDISEYLAEYAVSKAYLLTGANINQNFKIEDVPGNNISKSDMLCGDNAAYASPEAVSVGFNSIKGNSSVYSTIKTDVEATGDNFLGSGAYDITKYINQKNSEEGFAGVFSMRIAMQYDGTLYVSSTEPNKRPRLYIELASRPAVSFETTEHRYAEGNIKINVNAQSSSGIEKVEYYIDDELKATVTEGTDNIYSANISDITRGYYTLKVVAVDANGITAAAAAEIEVYELIKTSDVILAAAEINTEDGNAEQTSGTIGGTIIVSSEAPVKDYYAGFDLSGLLALGYDIEKAWLLGDANEAAANAVVYGLDGTLADGQNYSDVPEPTGAPVSVSLNSLSALNRNDFIDESVDYELSANPEDYNFSSDVTDYVLSRVNTGAADVGFKMTVSEKGSYTLNKAPVLCLKYSGKNIKPTAELAAPADTEFEAKDTIRFEITATDTDGSIDRVEMFLNDKMQDNVQSDGDNYYIEFTGLETGSYTLKAVVYDDGGKSASVESGFTVVLQKAPTKIGLLSPTAACGVKYGDASYSGTDSNGNYWIQGSKTDPYGIIYALKYDISMLKDYQIDKAELITAGNRPQNNVVLQLKELYSDDWETGINYTQLPEYSSKSIAEASVSYTTALNTKGYELSNSAYTVAFDITDHVLNKRDNGENVSSYIITSTDDGRTALGNSASQPLLYVTYRENKRPAVTLTSPETKTIPPLSELTLSAEITDEDSDITEVSFEFDDEVYTAAQTDNVYSVTIPAAKITNGEHKLIIKAADWLGAKTVYNDKLYAVSYFIANKAFTDGEGNKPVIEAGKTLKVSADVLNGQAGSLKAVIMLAMYNENNTMKAFSFGKAELSVGEEKTLEAELTIPDTLDLERAAVKAYITDGFRSMNILDSAAALE